MIGTLQRVVLPALGDDEVRGLYLRGDDPGVRILDRSRTAISDGATASYGTYFNAFPAAYWAHSTGLRSVTLDVTVEGSGVIRLFRSDASGVATVEGERSVADGTARFDVSLAGFDEGGWLWFDAQAVGSELIVEGTWVTDQDAQRPARATIGITTYNKPDYCVGTLAALGRDTALREHLARVFVIDQGNRHVADETGFADAALALGDLLEVIRQPNLGGSGGYARAMAETLEVDDAEFVMLIDDDVQIEPESVRRAIVFGSYCTTPTIVGGHMIDLLDRTKLYAWAEVVDEKPFMWRALHEDRMPIDLGATDLRSEPLLHRRMEAGYNGWWMCLIPRIALERSGLPLPAFIKWDDAEYSLRAARAGIPTVSLPGVALWHISWVGKDDLIDWQAYFHARNRIVSALLHSTQRGGGSLLTHSRRVDIKHLMSMQYYPVALRHRALQAVLSGPEHLHPDLRRALPAARALASEYPETDSVAMPEAAETSALSTRAVVGSEMPTGAALRVFMIRSLLSQWFHRPRATAGDAPEVVAPAGDARWWRMARYDSAVVAMAGTAAPHLYVRDRDAYRSLLRESIRLHRELHRRWAELAESYRAADITSRARWMRTLHSSPDGDAPATATPPSS